MSQFSGPKGFTLRLAVASATGDVWPLGSGGGGSLPSASFRYVDSEILLFRVGLGKASLQVTDGGMLR